MQQRWRVLVDHSHHESDAFGDGHAAVGFDGFGAEHWWAGSNADVNAWVGIFGGLEASQNAGHWYKRRSNVVPQRPQ